MDDIESQLLTSYIGGLLFYFVTLISNIEKIKKSQRHYTWTKFTVLFCPKLHVPNHVNTSILDCNLVHRELVKYKNENIVYMISEVKFALLSAQNTCFGS
jgi:hypothetical protein